MKPIHIDSSDETAAVVCAELARIGQTATWGKMPDDCKYVVTPKAIPGPGHADRLRADEIMRVIYNMRADGSKVSSCNSFTVSIRSREPSAPATPPAPAISPVARQGTKPAPMPVQAPAAPQRPNPATFYGVPCDTMTIVSCAYGDDRARINAARKAMLTWNRQSLRPHFIFVELLAEGLSSRYADVLPEGRTTHIIKRFNPWQCRGLMQKEALLNIGAAYASPMTEVIVFMDNDCWSDNPSWFAEILLPFVLRKKTNLLVQGYRYFQDTQVAGRCHYSVGSQVHLKLPANQYLHPGLCWAMRMGTYRGMGGLNPLCISGSGDVLLIEELCKGAFAGAAKYEGTTRYWNRIVRHGLTQCDLDCANADIWHEYHGEYKNRAYWDSRIVIDWTDADVVDLVELHDGILRWRNPYCRLAEVISDKVMIGQEGLQETCKKKGLFKHTYHSVVGWFDFQRSYRQIIRDCPNYGTIVEIGVMFGKSTSFLAVESQNSGKKLNIISCDVFGRLDPNGIPFAQHMLPYPASGNAEEVARESLKRTGCADRVDLLRKDGHALASEFDDESVFAVWIDADHRYASTLRFLEEWWPKVAVGGYLGLHDYINATWPEVKKAADEWAVKEGVSFTADGISVIVRKERSCRKSAGDKERASNGMDFGHDNLDGFTGSAEDHPDRTDERLPKAVQ